MNGGQPYRRKQSKAPGCLVALLLLVVVAAAVAYATGVIAHVQYELSGVHEQGVEAVDSAFEARVEEEFQDRYYAYSQLDEENRRCYRIMYDAFEAREPRAYPESGEETLPQIRGCVMADHPELFYVEGARLSTTYNQVSELVSDVSIEGTYYLDADETAAIQAQVDIVTSSFLSSVPHDADDYTKAKLAYDYVVQRASYDHSAAEALNWYDGEGRPPGQSLDTVFLDSTAVCAGYSSAYQYLLQHMGIQCVQVRGSADGVGHAWCIALLDGAYYHIDPTWGDPQFLDEEFAAANSYVNYEYFAVTTDDISATHVADDTFPIPSCTAAEDNYFVREGLMFEWADTERLVQLVSDAEAAGSAAVQVRCADDETYRALLDGFVATGDLGYNISDLEYSYAFNDALRTITVFP